MSTPENAVKMEAAELLGRRAVEELHELAAVAPEEMQIELQEYLAGFEAVHQLLEDWCRRVYALRQRAYFVN